MTKIVTAHQPNYLPWIGFFSKIKQSDCFVIADTVLMGDQSFCNRNRVRVKDRELYLTVPIGRRSNGMKICDITLPSDNNWKKNHWETIHRNYVRAEFFRDHKNFFEELYQKDFKYLQELNTEIILYLLKCFEIEVEILKASQLAINPELRSTDFIVALNKCAGADVYLSGPSGRNYLESSKFQQQNIKLKFFKFDHPVYKQRYPGFEPNMSAIDLLFNLGPLSAEVITSSGRMED